MYNILMYFVWFGVSIAAIFDHKIRLMWRGQRRAFRILKRKVDPNAKYVWVHAASLGEFEQGRPIIERIRLEHPDYKILLTFFSPSGYEVRKNYPGADIITYLPIDTVTNARRFLRTVRPVAAFFIKYEFWYNYLHVLRHRRMLLEKIGIHEVEITGDTRFDRVMTIKSLAKELPIVESFVKGSEKVFVAGSSWGPDEDVFIPYFNEHKDWKLIIAPHVIGEVHLKQILSKLQRNTVRFTQTTPEEAATADCLLIDCFGLLSSIYNYGTVAYIGGGFGVGIHNTLEAAVWNMPVIIGPNNKKFDEAQGLMQAGGCFEIHDAAEFETLMDRFDTDKAFLKDSSEKAGQFVKGQAGATDRILYAVPLK